MMFEVVAYHTAFTINIRQCRSLLPLEIIKGRQQLAFDKVILSNFDSEYIRLVMLNTSQSVALDRYSEITEQLLSETKVHTSFGRGFGSFSVQANMIDCNKSFLLP